MSGGRMFGSTISNETEATSVVTVEGTKCKIMSAEDVKRDLTWDEINGVRRIVKEEWHSVQTSATLPVDVKVVRDFVYQTVDPFDLVEINDSLQVA
jgi:hypothetical protein